MKILSLSTFAALLALPLASAHGPALSLAQLQRRTDAHHKARRAFDSCHSTLSKRSFNDGHERREELIRRFQGTSRARVNEKRDDAATPTQRVIATGTNTLSPFTGIPTCVLAPESELGPYCMDV